jgi:AraC family transcriptional regulator of adaptative response/methylated-DNA-[protein]-cysteine methyltransferase
MHYSEIAFAIGQLKATRADARACATNLFAIGILCQRVVPKAGGIGRYRWRSERKTKLLSMKKQIGL